MASLKIDDPKYRAEAKTQLIRGGAQWETICEVFRLLYDEIHQMQDRAKKERMTELLIDGIIMGKSMHARLKYYQRKYTDTTGKKGKGLRRLYGSINRRRERAKREL